MKRNSARSTMQALALLTSLKRGKTLVTLAPEMTTPETIGKLTAAGVIVSAGHTNASYDEIVEAYRHGLTGFTHLFNAMSPLTSREPGVVGAALANPDSYCGIIVDGRHVHPETLKLALRCKPHDRFMLVTDAWSNVGTVAHILPVAGRHHSCPRRRLHRREGRPGRIGDGYEPGRAQRHGSSGREPAGRADHGQCRAGRVPGAGASAMAQSPKACAPISSSPTRH